MPEHNPRPAREYAGLRLRGVWRVFVDGDLLHPRESQRVRNHSPNGFAWGYSGSGPAQLALAIMLRECATQEEAENLYQRFKCEIIAWLEPVEEWKLYGEEIRQWISGNRPKDGDILQIDDELLPPAF